MHDSIAPCATDTTNQGSSPLVFAEFHLDCINYFFVLPLPLTLSGFLGAGGAGFRIRVIGKYDASVDGTNPGIGQHCIPIDNGTSEPCVYTYG